jgi:hypothetical protein
MATHAGMTPRRDSVAGGMAIRLRYDEGEIDVGWSHRCGWRRH